MMNREKELGTLALMAGGFATLYCLPLGWPRFDRAAQEALALTKYSAPPIAPP